MTTFEFIATVVGAVMVAAGIGGSTILVVVPAVAVRPVSAPARHVAAALGYREDVPGVEKILHLAG